MDDDAQREAGPPTAEVDSPLSDAASPGRACSACSAHVDWPSARRCDGCEYALCQRCASTGAGRSVFTPVREPPPGHWISYTGSGPKFCEACTPSGVENLWARGLRGSMRAAAGSDGPPLAFSAAAIQPSQRSLDAELEQEVDYGDVMPRGLAGERANVVIAACSALGGLLFGYDTGVVAGALLFVDIEGCNAAACHAEPVNEELCCSDTRISAIVAVALVAAAVGALIAGPLLDKRGRQPTALISAGLFAVGGAGLALATSFAMLLSMRIVVGLAIGVASEAVPVYIAEMTPPERRGQLGTIFQLMVVVGILVSALVDLALAESGSWRTMFGLSVIPAVLMIGGMLTMPESPRYLVAAGRRNMAAAVLHRLRPTRALADAELAAIIEVVEAEAAQPEVSWSELLAPQIRSALFVGCGINFLS